MLDIPSGNGFSLKILEDLNVQAEGADLFPELSRVSDVPVHKVDLSNPLPFEDDSFDGILCQEGIEHVGA